MNVFYFKYALALANPLFIGHLYCTRFHNYYFYVHSLWTSNAWSCFFEMNGWNEPCQDKRRHFFHTKLLVLRRKLKLLPLPWGITYVSVFNYYYSIPVVLVQKTIRVLIAYQYWWIGFGELHADLLYYGAIFDSVCVSFCVTSCIVW